MARCSNADIQHVAIIRPDSTKLSPRSLRYFLVSPAMQAELLSLAGAGGTRNALTEGMIQSLEIRAPKDVRVQCAIAQTLSTLDDKIESNRRMNETLETMARTIFRSWFVDFEPVRAKAEGRNPGLPEAYILARIVVLRPGGPSLRQAAGHPLLPTVPRSRPLRPARGLRRNFHGRHLLRVRLKVAQDQPVNVRGFDLRLVKQVRFLADEQRALGW